MSVESVPWRPVSVGQGPITVAESDLMTSVLPISSSRATPFFGLIFQVSRLRLRRGRQFC